MIQDFKSWLDKPFSGEMSALKWFGFVGLIFVALVIWGSVLRHFE